jgi:hypothetical protein
VTVGLVSWFRKRYIYVYVCIRVSMCMGAIIMSLDNTLFFI